MQYTIGPPAYYHVTTFVANSQGSSFMYYAFYNPPIPPSPPTSCRTACLPFAAWSTQFVKVSRVSFHRRRFVAMQALTSKWNKIWDWFPLFINSVSLFRDFAFTSTQQKLDTKSWLCLVSRTPTFIIVISHLKHLFASTKSRRVKLLERSWWMMIKPCLIFAYEITRK